MCPRVRNAFGFRSQRGVCARRDAARTTLQATTKNISRLVLRDAERLRDIEIDGRAVEGTGRPTLYLGKTGGVWRTFDSLDALRGGRPVKRPGLQGPIDDAFTAPFQAVRPDRGSSPELELFQKEYRKWLRAEVPVVSSGEADLSKHVALFGTPETNALLAKIADRLPKKWETGLRLIAPNPLNPDRYAVVNSGHTFHEAEFRGTNALLFPRLGDWAIVGDDGKVREAGYFDENWG